MAYPAQRGEIHEFFVLDDGSTDGSRELIEQYTGKLDFWTSEKDGGQAAAIDRGFRRDTGDVLYWINSDNLLLPGAVARMRKALAAPGAPPVFTGWDVLIDADSMPFGIRRPPAEVRSAPRWGQVPAPVAPFRVHPAQKGSSWLERYAQEHRLLERRCPECFSKGLASRIGVGLHRAKEVARGRCLRDRLATVRLRVAGLEEGVRSLNGEGR